MATSFDKIIDMGLVVVNDYALDNLFEKDSETFNQFCDGFVVRAASEFKDCRQPLTFDLDAREFNSDLTLEEITILADFWVLQWTTRKANDASALMLKIQAGNFKNHSEAQWNEKMVVKIDGMREKLSQRITAYQLDDLSNIGF